MLQVLKDTDTALPPSSEVKLPSRVLRLPLAFGDQWTKAAIERCTLKSTSRGPSHAVRHMCGGPGHLKDPDGIEGAVQVHEISTQRCPVSAEQHRLLRSQQWAARRSGRC
jgi:hypothetical protein